MIRDETSFYTHESLFFHASATQFKKIPGHPIAYWVSERVFNSFRDATLGDLADIRGGMSTSSNVNFVRYWPEVSISKSAFDIEKEAVVSSVCTWFVYNKGGEFRKWFGNRDFLVNWRDDGADIKNAVVNNPSDPNTTHWSRRIFNTEYFFEEGLTWGDINTSVFSARYLKKGAISDGVGIGAYRFKRDDIKLAVLALLNSKVFKTFSEFLCPTLHFNSGPMSNVPIPKGFPSNKFSESVKRAISIAETDWNSYETSWNFTGSPLFNYEDGQLTVSTNYGKLRTFTHAMILEMQRLEEENNRILIDAYGLQDELTPEVPLEEITLTCNPHYRYKLSGQWLVASDQQREKELEARLLQDTMKEFISYAVGCMFGRYSLEKPGLILANQGDTFEDYVREVESWKLEGERVASGQWPVASQEGENYACEKLQGSDCLAEGHGFGSAGVSGDQTVSEGGALRADQSGEASGSVSSLEHRRGASATINGGVQKLSVDSKGIPGGSGNSTADGNSPQLSDRGTSCPNHGSASRGQQNDSSLDVQTSPRPLATSHWPLATDSFLPDKDNVIPILDGDWFADDISERFRKFLRITFGEDHFDENLRFIEQAIGKDVQKYFITDFYSDHVQRYKKRPIYWMFSSPKGSFNALIYMHRYRPDTVSVVLNDYLREFRTKLNAKLEHLLHVGISADASKSDKTKALKEIEKIKKIVVELEDYEREVLYPLAAKQIEIDLDDGVKVNYPKFGSALKHVPGLS